MTATFKPFKNAAISYNAVRDYIKEHTSAASPVTINQIYSALADKVDNSAQVHNAIQKFKKQGKISSMREGQRIVVWWRSNESDAPEVSTQPTIKTKTHVVKTDIISTPVREVKDVNMPEVQITKNVISILAGGVKISIERY